MPILPLPQFEADVKALLDEQDRATYEALKAPKTLVVRFGAMKMVGEFPFALDSKPGCGSKVVVRTHRGTELGEMLTSTCPNSGCSKSVSRKDMLTYIQNSGGRDYPFYHEGRVLRIADSFDLDRHTKQEQSRHELKLEARRVSESMSSPVRIVDAEPILGGEVLTFFYLSEERIDVRELYETLGRHFQCRIDLKQVGARDEARLTADYERCGQYCCCKNFLKVLKPVSMKSAKTQKATLDPLKISGRCGRLMCCLRYEDETYEALRQKLPKKKSRVGTPEGDGLVLDTQILTQLVLVLLDQVGTDGKDRQVAVAVEDLTPPINAKAPVRADPPVSGPESRGGFRGGRPTAPMPGSQPRGNEGAREDLNRGSTSSLGQPSSGQLSSGQPTMGPANTGPANGGQGSSGQTNSGQMSGRSTEGNENRPPRRDRPPVTEGRGANTNPKGGMQPPRASGGPGGNRPQQGFENRPAKGGNAPGGSGRGLAGGGSAGGGPDERGGGPREQQREEGQGRNRRPAGQTDRPTGGASGGQPGGPKGGPEGGADRGSRPPAPQTPRKTESVDDLWNEMETDTGDAGPENRGPARGGPSGPGGEGGPGQGGRRRRRRRGGRGGGQGGGQGGGSGNAGGAGGGNGGGGGGDGGDGGA